MPLLDILEQPDDVRTFWTQSGIGDYFAALSAAIDSGYNDQKLDESAIRSYLPNAFANLDWVNARFFDFNRQALEKIANMLHESSIYDIQEDTNLNRIGGEHALYRVIIDQNPYLRWNHASHGHIVAVGTVINAKIHATITGNDALYNQVVSAFTKLNLPFTWSSLKKLGITREILENALKDLPRGATGKSLLIDYFKENNCDILDEIFS